MPEHYPDIAQKQHGLVTREQLHRCELTDDAIGRRVREGLLVRLHAGVFAVAGTPDTMRRRILAAVLAAGGDAVASHTAAAALHGLGELRPVVEISVPRAQRPRLRGALVHRVTVLPPAHVVRVEGIPGTSRARTLCDLAGVLERDALEVVLDHALARRRVRRRELVAVLESLPSNLAGLETLKRLLAARPDGRARVESPLESELQRLLRRARVRGWVPQYEIAGRRADVAFPEDRLVVQGDSYKHHSSRSDWALDHTRNVDFVSAGWRVLPVTHEDLRRRPDEVIARIRSARRVPHLGRFLASGARKRPR